MKLGEVVSIVQNGGVGVLPTDTLYGVVGSALDERAVARIYKLRKRNLKKPMIVLISSMSDVEQFGVRLMANDKKVLGKLWPGRVSVVLPCASKKLAYLHRGTKSIAFRLPKPKWLQKLLQKTGPLVAPSANPEGEPPAFTISQAKKYFGKNVDFSVDKGKLASKPSTLVKIVRGGAVVLREGAVKVM